jgi:hypothetical protein
MLRELTRFAFTARRATASIVAGCASPRHLCAMRSVAGVMLMLLPCVGTEVQETDKGFPRVLQQEANSGNLQKN